MEGITPVESGRAELIPDRAAMLRDTLERAVARLAPLAEAIFVREPLLDPECPETGDLDLLVVGPVDDLLPERLDLGQSDACGPPVDLVWLPRASLEDPEALARNGLIAHRFVGARPVYDGTGAATARQRVVRRAMYRAGNHRQRVVCFLDMGAAAVREIGITWDFPALALFWLHVAHVACLAAVLDAERALCPNVYTRPFGHLRRLERRLGSGLERRFVRTLRLVGDPAALIEPLRRIHAVVAERFPEPAWPDCMPSSTRAEYHYSLSAAELDWRIATAGELARRVQPAAALFCLRFWAYGLARIPMVHQRACEGIGASFLRPERAVRPDLGRHCPEILDDLELLLGGEEGVSIDDVLHALVMARAWRDEAIARLVRTGFDVSAARPWEPFKPPPAGDGVLRAIPISSAS